MSINDVDWGDAPSWLGAVLTGAALLAAVLGLNSERRARHEDATRQRRAQARLVSVTVFPSGASGVQGSHMDVEGIVRVRNASFEAITDVLATMWCRVPSDPTERTKQEQADLIAPGDELLVKGTWRVAWSDLIHGAVEHRWEAEATFTDAQGLGWSRSTLSGVPLREL